MIEWTISLGAIINTVITAVTLIGSAIGAIWGIKVMIAVQSAETTALRDSQAKDMATLGGRVINIETELREIRTVMATQAVQDVRITEIMERMNRVLTDDREWRSWVRNQLDELRRVVTTN